METVFNNERPIYLQIVEQMKMDIIAGKYQQGEKLPSVRELASQFKVNPNTMQRAYMELENEELVYTERTSGRYVTDRIELINEIKHGLVIDKITNFLAYMNSMGIKEDGLITYIKNVREDES